MSDKALEFDDITQAQFMSELDFLAHDQALAKEISLKTGVERGVCLEVYSGNAFLSLALAQITDLKMFVMENSWERLGLASKNIQRFKLEKQIKVFKGNAHNIPFPNGTFDLVLSKNSLFFKQNKMDLYREIYRVLAPGGLACLFYQFNVDGITDFIHSEEYDSDLMHYLDNRDYKRKLHFLKKNLAQARIPSFAIYKRQGFWVFIWRSCIQNF